VTVWIGTAGWTIPRGHADRFPGEGQHLERYARVFNAVELNSSFKQTHRPSSYRRWADLVPVAFRFSVKFPRAITHQRRLVDVDEPLGEFLEGVKQLGEKLGSLLVQLPPSLTFDARLAEEFLGRLRDSFAGTVVVEPRHASWFAKDVDRFLAERRLPRLAADPAPAAGADQPGGWKGVLYYRLHGTPAMYRSPYSREFLAVLATRLREASDVERWVIFDNTAEGQAVPNALDLLELLAPP
jgi:uncharacterized protein YecE (DUF72 family)